MDLAALEQERAATLASFRDPARSPLAAVARHDFPVGGLVQVGSGDDCAVKLTDVEPHAASLLALPDGFELRREGRVEQLPPAARVQLGRYTLRLSHQNFPGLVVLDPQSPALAAGPFPRWFAPDAAFSVEGRLQALPVPREEVVLSTRGNRRRGLRLGSIRFDLLGQPLSLTALRLLEPGTGEDEVSIFFRDATTGQETYPVGRYVNAQPLGEARYLLDFNRAFNPACAFSPLFNCPIPPRENLLPVAVRAGELSPH